MRRVAINVAVVLAIITAFVVAWQLLSIVLLFIISLVIAATARGPIDKLMAYGLPRGPAMMVVYGVGVVGTIALFYGLSVALAGEFSVLGQDLVVAYNWLQANWQNGQSVGSVVAQRLPTPEQFAALIGTGETATITQALIGLAQGLGNFAGQLPLAIVVSIYWTADELRFERLWLSLLPPEARAKGRRIWRTLEEGVGAYIRSEAVQSLVAGVLITGGYWLLGIAYPVLWGVIAGFTWLIPLVGGLFTIIPLAIFVWMTLGPVTAALAVVYTVAVFALMEFVVERRLYTRDRYGRVLVLVIMIAMVDAFSLLGLLIAPLVATTIQIFLNEMMRPTPPRPSVQLAAVPTATGIQSLETGSQTMATGAQSTIESIDITDLQTRLEAVQAMTQNLEGGDARRIANMAERLEDLLQEAQKV